VTRLIVLQCSDQSPALREMVTGLLDNGYCNGSVTLGPGGDKPKRNRDPSG